MMKRDECLGVLAHHVGEDIVVAVYSTAFDWIKIRPHPLNYICVGAMGLAPAHALGLALGRPDKRVLVLDGDGSLLMSLGALVTVADVAPRNLIHFVFENGTYEANGGHPIPGRDRVDFVGFARDAGYRSCHAFDDLAAFTAGVASVLREQGPVFVDLKVERGAAPVYDYEIMHGTKVRDDFRAALMKS
jgi:sulfopyruvate decarboxylase subunit beta